LISITDHDDRDDNNDNGDNDDKNNDNKNNKGNDDKNNNYHITYEYIKEQYYTDSSRHCVFVCKLSSFGSGTRWDNEPLVPITIENFLVIWKKKSTFLC
jgi:hypothetical protein